MPKPRAVASTSSVDYTTVNSGSNRRFLPQKPKEFKLMVHGHEFHQGEELVINPEAFPNVQANDILEISQPGRYHRRLMLQVVSIAPVKGQFQVSILKEIAAQFNLEAFRNVIVQKVNAQSAAVDFIELTFKDQFISRADIWRFKLAMYGRSVYSGKTLQLLGARAQVVTMLSSGQNVECGTVGEDTKLILRSRSSRLFWLIQMGTEMWEFSPRSGVLHYEKLLDSFVKDLVSRWQEASTSHSVTIILFSRTYYDKKQFPAAFDPTSPVFSQSPVHGVGPGTANANAIQGYSPTIHVDIDGRYYEDFYQVIARDYTGPDWSKLITMLKQEFVKYHERHRWRSPQQERPAKYNVRIVTDSNDKPRKVVEWEQLPYGVPTRSVEGNSLEAINLVLNILDKHYMDRDLSRSGQSILMLTAGSGVFKVQQRLAQITKQRMMDNGVGMDLLSLTTPPLHIAPLFIWSRAYAEVWSASLDGEPERTLSDGSLEGYTSTESIGGNNTLRLTEKSFNEDEYNIPHWINISFLDLACECDRLAGSLASQVCDCARLEDFCPLPYYRMFDITAPQTDQTFPVTLTNILKLSTKDQSARSPPMPVSDLRDVGAQEKVQNTVLNRLVSQDTNSLFVDCASISTNSYKSPVLRSSMGSLGRFVASTSSNNYRMSIGDSSNTQAATHEEQVHHSYEDMEKYDSMVFHPPREVAPELLLRDQSKRSITSRKGSTATHGSNERIESSAQMAIVDGDKGEDSKRNESQPRDTASPESIKSIDALSPRATTSANVPLGPRNLRTAASSREIEISEKFRRDAEHQRRLDPYSRKQRRRSIDFTKEGNPSTDSPVVSVGASPSSISPSLGIEGSPGRTLSTKFASQSTIRTARAGPLMNPFQSSATEWEFSQRLSSNRRRWSHLFPTNPIDHKTLHSGPNWISLIMPAVLPITTDYYPQPNRLHLNYTESFYTLTLNTDDSAHPSFKNIDELVTEMVCQRLGQDFQIVISQGANRLPTLKNKHAPGGDRIDTQNVYHVSMGHRIHQIMCDKELGTIDVKRIVKRYSANEDTEPYIYEFSLLVEEANVFRPGRQEFREFPSPEYNWNYVDQLLCGHYDNMMESSKYRRIRYVIIPPVLQDQAQYDQHIANFQKFLDYIQIRIGKYQKVNVQLLPFGSKEPEIKQLQSQGFKVGLTSASSDSRQEWLILQLHTVYDMHRCYQIEMQWLACSGAAVDDFVSSLNRKGKAMNLDLCRVPEFAKSSYLEIHPLLTPTFFPLPRLTSAEGIEQDTIVNALVQRFDFIFFEAKICDDRGVGSGLGIEMKDKPRPSTYRTYRLNETALAERRRMRGYWQYMHRTQPIFVRVISNGVIWIPGYAYERNCSDTAASDLLYKEFVKFLETTMLVYDLASEIVNLAQDASLE